MLDLSNYNKLWMTEKKVNYNLRAKNEEAMF